LILGWHLDCPIALKPLFDGGQSKTVRSIAKCYKILQKSQLDTGNQIKIAKKPLIKIVDVNLRKLIKENVKIPVEIRKLIDIIAATNVHLGQ